MAVLQICIPTFERREHLMNTLAYLDSERQGDLHDFISVRILDNGSGYDIRDVVQSRFPYVQVDVNPENIGAPSSVVRLVREGQTEYVMVLGDDDDYRPGLLPAIRELLVRQQPDYIFLNHRAVWHDGRLALPTQLPPGEINSLLDIFNYTGHLYRQYLGPRLVLAGQDPGVRQGCPGRADPQRPLRLRSARHHVQPRLPPPL